MEEEIINQLNSIRVYIFIIMCIIAVWASLKSIESIQNILSGFKRAWDTLFINKVSKCLDVGDYDRAIRLCRLKLDKLPEHSDAHWLIARAYFYNEENDLARKYFEKAVYFIPEWKESAEPYINELNNR